MSETLTEAPATGMEAANEEDAAAEALDSEDVSTPDPKAFKSLKGRINYDTLKALTVRPLRLVDMTPVQERVTALLPDLVRPWDPEGIVSPKVPNPLPPGWEPPIIDPNAPRDILVRAQTGTGKTIAFLIPAIQSRLNYIEHNAMLAVINAGQGPSPHLAGRARHAFRRACAGPLILSPTRELALQIANDALKLTTHQKEFEVRLFVGGATKRQQMREWMRFRRDLVVATPGRLRDLLENEPEVRNGFKDCPMLILDEADMLLDMGFRDDLDAIMSYLPPSPARQTFLFSATLSRQIRQSAASFLSPNHLFIDATPGAPSLSPDKQTPMALALPPDDELTTHSRVPQFHTLCPTASDPLPTLFKLIAHDQLTHGNRSKVIVFCPTTHMTALYATLMRRLGSEVLPNGQTNIWSIHSKLEQRERDAANHGFRKAASKKDDTPAVLVSSDVSARGVDYPGVTRVIQVGVPSSEASYVHRVGRVLRGSDAMAPGAANEGARPNMRADMLLLPWEAGYLTWQLTNMPLKPLPISVINTQLETLSVKSGSAFSTETLRDAISDLLPSLDPHAIRSTAASLLGYYLPLNSSLRAQPASILSGIYAWALENFNIPISMMQQSPKRNHQFELYDENEAHHDRVPW
ncbi:hypothetical protein HYDPIDRAFT_168742 [Hydnomerulius pinastri MD-312]|uniref:ATP-dependent RNA helicase n=1 Tax=Hydnomerulius pinastri MD-312 TaxID=994086 RepID=A0A0C9VC63_9AGAM|nr:hypothetical protein HYDPIDRAFT_168742 [Hydnomerulius pinastri MD-312]